MVQSQVNYSNYQSKVGRGRGSCAAFGSCWSACKVEAGFLPLLINRKCMTWLQSGRTEKKQTWKIVHGNLDKIGKFQGNHVYELFIS